MTTGDPTNRCAPLPPCAPFPGQLLPRLLGVFEACFLLICRATKYSILDTRALRLKNLKPAKFSFRSHNFQMAKFESWQAAIERCCQLQACIVRSDVQTDRQTDGRTDEQIQLNFGFTLSIKHTTRWLAAVKAIAGPWLLTSNHYPTTVHYPLPIDKQLQVSATSCSCKYCCSCCCYCSVKCNGNN